MSDENLADYQEDFSMDGTVVLKNGKYMSSREILCELRAGNERKIDKIRWLKSVFDDFEENHWVVADADEVKHFVEWVVKKFED